MEQEGEEGEVALSTLTEEMEDLANLLEAVQLDGHSADWLDSVQLVQDDVRTFQKIELMRLGKRSMQEEAQTPPTLMQPSEATNAIREKLAKVRELKSRAPFVNQESGKIPGEISHLTEQMDMLRYLSGTKNEAKEQDDQAWLEAVRIVGEEVAAIELEAEELNNRSIDKLAQILKLRGILTSSFPYVPRLNIHQYPAVHETVFYKKLASKMSELVSIRDDFLNSLGTSKLALGGEVKDRPKLGWNDQVDTIGEEVARIEFEMRKLRKRAVKKLQRVHELKSGGIHPARLPLMNVLVGIDSKMEELKSWVSADDVGVIGIVGPGGIGKTSLLRQIQSGLSLEGYKPVIYVNIKKNSAMLEQVQKEIIQKLDFPWLDDASLRTRAVFNALNRNKFALLLDNVTGMLDLQSIGVPIGRPESKSQNKVIVATESRVVCYQMGAERLLVMEGLTEAQAWHLFQQNAWKGIDSTDLEPEFVRLGRLLAENNVLVDLNSGPREWSVASRICLVDSNNQTLLLQNNTICRVPRGFFRQMPHLKILDLSRTRISVIPSGVGMLGNLRFLNLAYTELTSLPTELGQLAKLAHPDLTCTFSPSVIPHQALPMLSRMQVPYMVGCVYVNWIGEDSNDDDEVGSRKLVGHVGGQPGDAEKKISYGGDDERGMGNWKSISYGGDDERGMGNWKTISYGGDDERGMGNWKSISCGGDDERRMGNRKLISCGGDDERGMGNWKLTSHGGADESGMVDGKLISHGGDDERMMGNWKLEKAPEREPGNWQSHGGDDERGLGHCRLETSSSKDDSRQVSFDDLKCFRQSSDLRLTSGTARFFNSPVSPTPMLPKYMAVTESAKARVRSHSAPRPPPGTPEKDRAAARKRFSFPVPAPVPDPCYRCRYLFRSPSFKSAKGSLVGEQRSNVSSSYGTASEEKSRRARRRTSGDGSGEGGGRPFSYSTPKTAPRPKQQPPLHRSPATPSPSKARTLYVRATSLPFSYSSPFASVISGAAARNHHKPTVPNYMAATESAKARLRSHSAPP